MRTWLLSACLAFMAGCSSLPTVVGSQGGVGEPATSFDLSGRLGVKYEKGGQYGQLSWRHRKDSDEIDLRSPIGTQLARLDIDPAGARLDLGDGAMHAAPTVEGLSRELLGWELPLSGLRYWVQAMPEPGAPASIERDEQGRPYRLEQAGWTIDYDNYAQALPGKLILRRQTLEIRLVIDDWNLAP